MVGELEILECFDDAVLAVDSRQKIIASNRAARRLFAVEESTLTGVALETLIVPSEATVALHDVVRNVDERRHRQGDVSLKVVKRGEPRDAIGLKMLPRGGRGFDGTLCIFQNVERREHPRSFVDTDVRGEDSPEVRSILQGSYLAPLAGSFETAARTIYDICKHAIGASAGYVALASPDRQVNEVVFLDEGEESCAVDPELPMPIRGLRGVVYENGEALFENDFMQSEWMKYMPQGHVGLDNVMMAPIVIAGDVVGVIGLANKQGGFVESDKRLAAAFGELAAIAWSAVNDRHANERLAMAIEQSSESVLITAIDGTVVYANPAFEEVTGFSHQEVFGHTPHIFKSDVHDEGVYKELWKSITRGGTWKGRLVNRKKDGTPYTVESTISPVRGLSGEVVSYIAVNRDITKELELSEQLIQAQKMEAIGLMAGGVAHDMNNILATILVTTSSLASKLEGESSEHEELDVINDTCHRGGDLTRNLLRFSGKGASQREAVDINDVVSETVRLIERSFLQKLRITTRLDEDLPLIWGDRSQLSQAMMNLYINAADAIVDHGRLTITTELDELATSTAGDLQRPSVQVTVSDTGVGIRPETLNRVFEPFFTTKPQGKGTGLGLSMVYGAVVSHGGSVDIKSKPNDGTCVTLVFPVHEESPPLGVMTPLPMANTETTAGSILLVDDERDLARFLADVLKSSGEYEVYTAYTGKEALELYSEMGDRISLVILDLMMLDMDGEEVFGELKRINPEVKVFITSGYAEDEMVERLMQAGAVDFLTKPFGLKRLKERVKLHIDGRI